ncbi:predicted protein [Lichtheimia corymbifera JMRC:FSU:9682]|uniref:Uncharacterized protein n=1 Tax=Lichtheimia corymbifera JMRC:FSU:9682 TaxID=1263082 RepID=A0A068RJ29_9FUNG|nr:predicted protein [Lichtheimia corymbifera JMRC:FSU:9682]
MPAETKPAETPISLKQTLEKSKLLTAKLRQNDLPPIERGLDQIDSQTHNLISKAAQGDDQSNVDVRAHYFLSKGRVNTKVLMRDLDTINLGAATEHRQPIQDTDVEGYFVQERTRTIVDTIQEGKQETLDDIMGQFDLDVQTTWQDLRSKLCDGYSAEQAKADMASMNITKSKIDLSRVPAAAAATSTTTTTR